MGRTDSEAVVLEVRGVVCVVIVAVCHVELSTKIYVEKPIPFGNRQTREESLIMKRDMMYSTCWLAFSRLVIHPLFSVSIIS